MREMWKRFWAFCVALVAPHACTQPTNWEMSNDVGRQAYQQGDYAEAEKAWLAALKQAETFGPEDSRLAGSLNNLAGVYHDQGNYAEAEPLLKRAAVIYEKALGPEHPRLAGSLHNLASTPKPSYSISVLWRSWRTRLDHSIRIWP